MAKCKNCNHLTVEIEKCLGVEVPFNYCPKTLDNPDIEINRICNYYDPITNADRIRSMTDEELAEWLYNTCDFFESGTDDPRVSIWNLDTDEEEVIDDSYGDFLEWLRAERKR